MESPLKHNTKSLEEKPDFEQLAADILFGTPFEHRREAEKHAKSFVTNGLKTLWDDYVQPLTQQVEELKQHNEEIKQTNVEAYDKLKSLRAELEERNKEREDGVIRIIVLESALSNLIDAVEFTEVEYKMPVTMKEARAALNSPVKQGE